MDTAYYRSGDDEGILRIASNEARIMLTGDKALFERARSWGLSVFLVEGRTDGNRLVSLRGSASRAGIFIVRGDPLCSLCGGPLTKVPKSSAVGKVPVGVASRHRLFYRCPTCDHYYWRGGHWKKLRRFARLLGTELENAE